MAALIKCGHAGYARKLGDMNFRNRVLSGQVKIPVKINCDECGGDCYGEFKGKILFIIGLNNAIKAGQYPNIKLNENTGFMMNAQKFDEMFNFLDQTIAKVNFSAL